MCQAVGPCLIPWGCLCHGGLGSEVEDVVEDRGVTEGWPCHEPPRWSSQGAALVVYATAVLEMEECLERTLHWEWREVGRAVPSTASF